jgi:hypothetical protein
LGDEIHWTSRIETACQRGAGVEPVFLVIKSACAAARINVGFKDRNAHSGTGEYGGGS